MRRAESIWPKQIIAPAIGINGTQGVRNCRSRSGLVFRRTTTLKQTIVKASNVPIETIELENVDRKDACKNSRAQARQQRKAS
jgi:hypothetical protein